MQEDKVLSLLIQKSVLFLVRGAGILVAFALAWLVAGFAYRAARRGLDKTELDATLSSFFANLLRYAILVGAFVACLGAVGFQTTTFAAIIGAAGLAIG
ncbi:MAG TPA: hypothetical protein VGP93_18795, partial [Polyangiaceae bacterium]|nr:hypothetical protein [Polyangiaceae bacterium]